MKKKYVKYISSFILTIVLIFSFSIDSFAYTLLPYELNGGVGNWGYNKRYYWLDTSATNIRTPINNAYNTWINTSHILSTPISWGQTTTKASGTVEFYTYRSYDGANGYTTFWRFSDLVSPEVENWGWCQIYYNYNYTGGQPTIAHEIGHTMGHDENNSDPYTIMCQEACWTTSYNSSIR